MDIHRPALTTKATSLPLRKEASPERKTNASSRKITKGTMP
jgi:hypothetical protein